MTDALLNLALSQAKDILTGDLIPSSHQEKIQAVHFFREQMNRLRGKPGDEIPLGLTQRQRYEILIFLAGAAATLQSGGEG